MATYTRHPDAEELGTAFLESSSDEDLSTFTTVMDDLTAEARRRYNAAHEELLQGSHDPEEQRDLEACQSQGSEQLRAYGVARVVVDLELGLRRQYRATLLERLNQGLETDDALTDAAAAAVELQGFER